MNRKIRRRLAITEAIAGGTSILAILGLLSTVGGMEQGNIDLGRGCVISVVMLALFCAAAIVEDAAYRCHEEYRKAHSLKRGGNRA